MAWKHDEGKDDSAVGGIGIWVWRRVDVEGGPLRVKVGDERGRGSNFQFEVVVLVVGVDWLAISFLCAVICRGFATS